MTFTLTATPQPFATPPRVLLEAEESDPDNPIQSCVFFRDGVPLRFSATAAGSTAIAYDFDAPFDVSLTYRADAVEAATIVSDFDESWPNISAWTSTVSGWGVSAGNAVSTTIGAAIKRAASGTIAKVTGADPVISGGDFARVTVALLDASNLVLASLDFEPSAIVLTGSIAPQTVAHVPNDFELTVGASTVSAVGSGWSLTTDFEGTPTQVLLTSYAVTSVSASLGELEVFVFADLPTVDVSDTDTVMLTGVDSIWLSNTAAPELAVQITPDGSSPDGLVISPETRKDTQSAAGSVLLDIEGSAYPMAVTNSPRKAETWTLVLHTLNADARAALKTLLANSAPVLLRAPSTFDYMRLDDGFYSVGDVSDGRVQEPWDNRDEIVTVPLPMQPLGRAPAFDVLWAWNLRTLAQTGMTLRDVANTFPSLRALLIGPS